MAMKKDMTLEQALAVSVAIAKGRAKYGSQYSPAYSQSQLLEAVVRLGVQATTVTETVDKEHKAELTKCRRQYAALNARHERIKDREALEGQLVSGFYEDEFPFYSQGAPTMELQYLVTADELNGLIEKLKMAGIKRNV